MQEIFTCLEAKLLQRSNTGDLLTCKARLFMPTRLCSCWVQQGNSSTSPSLGRWRGSEDTQGLSPITEARKPSCAVRPTKTCMTRIS